MAQEELGLVQDDGQDGEEVLRRKSGVELSPLSFPVVAFGGEDGVLPGQVPYVMQRLYVRSWIRQIWSTYYIRWIFMIIPETWGWMKTTSVMVS